MDYNFYSQQLSETCTTAALGVVEPGLTYADSRSLRVGERCAVPSRVTFSSCLLSSRHEAHLCKRVNNRVAVIYRQLERCEKKSLEEL